jgi:hypothetical protein
VRNKTTVIHHSHHEQSYVPPARDQAAKSRIAGIFLINMKWLRVPFLRKFYDFLSGDDDLPQVKEIAHFVIFGESWRLFSHDEKSRLKDAVC